MAQNNRNPELLKVIRPENTKIQGNADYCFLGETHFVGETEVRVWGINKSMYTVKYSKLKYLISGAGIQKQGKF